MDLKSLYTSAKVSLTDKAINAYKEAVNELLESDPTGYISNLEYIIPSSIGFSTFNSFIERYGISIAAYDKLVSCFEKCIDKCGIFHKDASLNKSYQEAYDRLLDFKNDHINAFILYEKTCDVDDMINFAPLTSALMEKFSSIDKFQEEYINAYYGLNINGIQKRRLLSGMINAFGEMAIPDLLITAKSISEKSLDAVCNHILLMENRAPHSAIYFQYLLENCRENTTDSIYIESFRNKSLEAVVADMRSRSEQMYREAAITGNGSLKMHYNQEELMALSELITFREYQMVCTESADKLLKLQNEIYSLYEEFAGMTEMVADSVAAMLPEGSMAWANTTNKKTGAIPEYLARNHNMNWGEDGDKKNSRHSIDDEYRRPSSYDNMPESEEEFQDLIDDVKSDETLDAEEKKQIVNYYYYTYNDSFNKNSNSYNKDSSHKDDHSVHNRSTDDHSTNKRINSHNNGEAHSEGVELYDEGFMDVIKGVTKKFSKFLGVKKNLAQIQSLDRPDIIMRKTPLMIPGTGIPLKIRRAVTESLMNNDMIMEAAQQLSKNDIKNVIVKLQKKFNTKVYFVNSQSSASKMMMQALGGAACAEMDQEHLDMLIRGKQFDPSTAKSKFNEPDKSLLKRVILVDTTILNSYKIASARALELLVAHEYGHVKTFDQVTVDDMIEYNVKREMLDGLISLYGSGIEDKAHANIAYYRLKLEALANNYSHIDPYELTEALLKVRPSGKLTWIDIDAIVNWQIPASIMKIYRDSMQTLKSPSPDEYSAILSTFSDLYAAILESSKAKEIINSIKEMEQSIKHMSGTMNESSSNIAPYSEGVFDNIKNIFKRNNDTVVSASQQAVTAQAIEYYYPLTDAQVDEMAQKANMLETQIKGMTDSIINKYPIYNLHVGVNKESFNDATTVYVSAHDSVRGIMTVDGKPSEHITLSIDGDDLYTFINKLEKDFPDEYKRLGEKYNLNSRHDCWLVMWYEQICGYDKDLNALCEEISKLISTNFPVRDFDFTGDYDDGPCFDGKIDVSYFIGDIPQDQILPTRTSITESVSVAGVGGALLLIYAIPIAIGGLAIAYGAIAPKIAAKRYKRKINEEISKILGKPITDTTDILRSIGREFETFVSQHADELRGCFQHISASDDKFYETKPYFTFALPQGTHSDKYSLKGRGENPLIISTDALGVGLVPISEIPNIKNKFTNISDIFQVQFAINDNEIGTDIYLPMDDNGGDWGYFIDAGICEGGPEDMTYNSDGETIPPRDDTWLEKQERLVRTSGCRVMAIYVVADAKKALNKFVRTDSVHESVEAMDLTESELDMILYPLIAEAIECNMMGTGYMTESSSDEKFKYAYKAAYNYENGHSLKIIYSLDGVIVTDVGDMKPLRDEALELLKKYSSTLRDGGHFAKVRATAELVKGLLMGKENVKRRKKFITELLNQHLKDIGYVDFQAKNCKIIEIYDRADKKKLTGTVKMVGIYAAADFNKEGSLVLSEYAYNRMKSRVDRPNSTFKITSIKAGDIQKTPTFMTTCWDDHADKGLVDSNGRVIKNDNVDRDNISKIQSASEYHGYISGAKNSTLLDAFTDFIDPVQDIFFASGREKVAKYEYADDAKRIARQKKFVNNIEKALHNMGDSTNESKRLNKLLKEESDKLVNAKLASSDGDHKKVFDTLSCIDKSIDKFKRILDSVPADVKVTRGIDREFLEASVPWLISSFWEDGFISSISETSNTDRPQSDHPIRDALMDIDKKSGKVHQSIKHGVQTASNVVDTATKPVRRGTQWVGGIIGKWKDSNENNIKEKMADPHARNLLFKAIRACITGGALLKAGLLLNPVFIFLAGTVKVSNNKKEFRLRNEMIGELKTEIAILDEKIRDADYDRDKTAKYQLMRFKNELQKKLLRVGGEKGWSKAI